MSTPSWSDVLRDADNIDERLGEVEGSGSADTFARLQVEAITNQTRALARLGEELQRVSFRTIATTDYM